MTEPFNKTGLRCRGCGYDLRAATQDRCSECGRRFDPSNPRTFICDDDRFQTGFNRKSRATGHFFLGVELALMLLVVATELLTPKHAFFAISLAVGFMPFAALLAALSFAVTGSSPGAIRKRELRLLALAIAAIPAFVIVWGPANLAIEHWRKTATIRRIERLVPEVEAFQAQFGRLPGKMAELSNARGLQMPKDPWGNPIELDGEQSFYIIRASHLDFLTLHIFTYDSRRPATGVVVVAD